MKFKDEDMNYCTIEKADTLEPCVECGDETKYTDYIFNLRVCSKECYDITTEKVKNTV